LPTDELQATQSQHQALAGLLGLGFLTHEWL
jgi:hypothetical protein